MTPAVAAHRGGAALWPENSLLAFRNAIALGVDFLELDVHPTADGEVAVIHDRTLDRTTDGTGSVATRSAAELRARRLRGPDGTLTGEPVPLLEEVLAIAAPSRVELLVELKEAEGGPRWTRRDGVVTALPPSGYEGLEARALEALEAAGLAGRATVMAFHPSVLTRVRAAAPAQRTALLVGRADLACVAAPAADAVDWARGAGATDLGLDHAVVDAAAAAAARAAGLRLGVWTVNDEDDVRRVVDLGVEVVTTDRPDLVLRVLGRA